ncbi:MAG: hypothetical protein ACAH21_15060 [Ramlibacter sp.]
MKYWITLDNSPAGPFTIEEIRAQFMEKISSSTPCAKIGTNEWSTAGSLLPELNLPAEEARSHNASTGNSTAQKENPQPATDSIYHSLANTAVGLLIAVFVIDLFLNGITREAARNGINWPLYTKTVVGMLLLVCAFICGLISLFGIRKYGRRKLLWKGLVCTLVPALSVAGAALAFQKVKSVKENNTHQQQAK